MEIQTKIAVIILNYNGIHWLRKFLSDVVNNSPNSRIYVADNASKDDSIEYITSNFPSVKIIKNNKNYGYAGGYNYALQRINAKYYVLLNSDIKVTNNWISPIIELMEKDKSIAACQPKVKKYDNKEYFEYAGASGGYIDKYGYPFCRGRIFDTIEKDEGQYDDTKEVFWATGACLFLRSSTFYEVGGFDYNFFSHMEEIDLCWRLKNKGYKIMCEPKSTVYHVGGGTLQSDSTLKTYLNYRNNLLMLYKNLHKNRFKIIFYRLILDGLSSFKFLKEGRPHHVFYIIKAHLNFFGMLKSVKKKKSKQYFATLHHESIVYAYFIENKKTFYQLKNVLS